MGMTETKLDFDEIDRIIENALNEDVRDGDWSTNSIVPENKTAEAYLKAKENGIIAGLPVAERVFKMLDPALVFTPLASEGEKVAKGKIIAEMNGSYRAILTGERTALNFIQRMSGIATETSKYVEAVSVYKTEILDTRKTVPGLRMLDKYSVKTGGGTNHRIGLFDMIMLKDNHIKIAGGIKNAVAQAKANSPKPLKIEVETSSINEVCEALESGADIVMLDNMDNKTMLEAVHLINGKAIVEASGNMTLDRVREVAALGVDYISIGALTHSVKGLDIGQYIK